MPTYTYRCRLCGTVEDVIHSIKEDARTHCFQCDADSLSRVLYPATILDATPKTLGSCMDRNDSTSWRNEKAARQQEENPQTSIFKKNKKLANLTTQEQKNYILTGKTTDPLTPEIFS